MPNVCASSRRRARAGQKGGGTSSPDDVSLTLNVQGVLGNLSRQEVENLVKQAYMEVATRGNSVRRTNASQALVRCYLGSSTTGWFL